VGNVFLFALYSPFIGVYSDER